LAKHRRSTGARTKQQSKKALLRALKKVIRSQRRYAARIGKLQPLKRSAMILAGAMTLLVVVYFAISAIHQF